MRKFAINSKSTLASSIGAGDISLTVATGDGSLFPAVTADNDEACSLKITGGGHVEYLTCIARSGDVFTLTRAAQAYSFAAGSKVEHVLTADDMDNFLQKGVFRTVTADPNGTEPDFDGEQVYWASEQAWYIHCPTLANTLWKRVTR